MTEQRVTQAGAEALIRVIPDADVTQAGVEYIHRVLPGMTLSQAGAEYLHRVQPGHTITQAGVEVLYKSIPCTTRWAQIWTITRTDGVVYRFTSLDRDLVWAGETYGSCNSLVPSASEAVSEADAAGTMDLSGALADGAISAHDLYAGLFDGAKVEAWLVPWQGVSIPKPLLAGTFGNVEQREAGFKVELLGDGAKLTQTPLVRLLQPGCRWLFGDNHCQKDLVPLTVTGTVATAFGQRTFNDPARSEAAGYFRRGRVTFTSGANTGVRAEIKEHAPGGVFTLWPRLPFSIVAGDAYSMTPGCTNVRTASGGTNGCTAWDNYDNYGGFLSVPTKDKLTAAVVAKE